MKCQNYFQFLLQSLSSKDPLNSFRSLLLLFFLSSGWKRDSSWDSVPGGPCRVTRSPGLPGATLPPGHAALSCNFYAVSGGSEVKLRYWFAKCVPCALLQQDSRQPPHECRSVTQAWFWVLMLLILELFGEHVNLELAWVFTPKQLQDSSVRDATTKV